MAPWGNETQYQNGNANVEQTGNKNTALKIAAKFGGNSTFHSAKQRAESKHRRRPATQRRE